MYDGTVESCLACRPGDYAGKDEVFGLFGRLAEMFGGNFRLDIHDILANDEQVVALVTTHAERAGKMLVDNGTQVFHIRDGKVTESWFNPEDQYAGDDFWS